MAEAPTIASRVLDALVVTDLLTTEQLAAARGNAETTGRTPGDLLLEQGTVSEEDIRRVLEDELGVPSVDLASYAPDEAALELVPASLAREYGVLPLFEIEGVLTVAVGSPGDVFGLEQVAARTGLEIEIVCSNPESVREAIDQCYGPAGVPAVTVAYTEFPDEVPVEPPAIAPVEGPVAVPADAPVDAATAVPAAVPVEAPSAAPVTVPASAPERAPVPKPEAAPAARTTGEAIDAAGEAPGPAAAVVGGPAVVELEEGPAGRIDLDVLAVADAGKTAILVADLLDLAVRRGASQIHVLPERDEFTVAFRVGPSLELVGRAPLSLEPALVHGFMAAASMPAASPGAPAVGRTRAQVGGRDVTLTISVMPTTSGPRLAAALSTVPPEAPSLDALGLANDELLLLSELAERGRGLVLLSSPADGGSSTTSAALMSRIAVSGRSAPSIERALGYELPNVAQVVLEPGSPIGAASNLGAALLQDTDAIGLDHARTAEEMELALKAAGSGKLVVVTLSAAGVVAAIRHALDLGVEPESLASGLEFVVAQRRVRTVCRACAVQQPSSLASLIPGADPQMSASVGIGCAACADTGFGGFLGLFEVLAVQDPIRSLIARGAPSEQLAAAVEAAGMRPMLAAGLARVREGLVSAEELDRVFRFSSGGVA